MSEFEKLNIISPAIVLTNKEFNRLGGFIMSQYGIKMPKYKRIFLQCRLQKRLRELNLPDFTAYNDFLFSQKGILEEIPHMIDAVSTNTTEFFREIHHFDFLSTKGLDEYYLSSGKKSISVWSAGCASGEEPYSIAMLLSEYSKRQYVDFSILATDISPGILQHASVGIYGLEKIQTIPDVYHKRYLLKGTGDYENKFRLVKEIRDRISFRRFNLVERDYRTMGKHDLVFCRNVLIYFEREIQNIILKKLCDQIHTGGYLFLGHSESVNGIDLPLIQIKPTIYMRIKE